MTEVLILVEGQTEEKFVVQAFQPPLARLGVFLRPTIITNKRNANGTNYKGGLSKFSRLENELRLLLYGAGPRPVTTFLDLYALPSDFPGFEPASTLAPVQRASELERHLREHFGDDNDEFRPYIQVHEAEALVLACPEQLDARHRGLGALASQVVAQEGGPELVDDGPTTAPSKRLTAWAPDYSKTGDGPAVVASAGLAGIRMQCPHFDEWISWLESLAP